MKKILLMVSSLALAVVALTCPKSSSRVSADGEKEVHEKLADLLNNYKDGNGNYTKKSKIYFNDETIEEASKYLHAQNVALERTTYYDDDYNGGGALLMGDYDGTFTHINSGYVTNSAGKLEHYRATDVSTFGSNLFSGNVDYTLNTTCNAYFDVLSGLAAEVLEQGKDAWAYEDGIYTHELQASLVLDEHGNYNDMLFKRFQYFGAPMLLQSAGAGASHYLSFTSIKVEAKGACLSIRLYVSDGDADKLTSTVEGDEAMLSEAKVYKGLGAYNAIVNGKCVVIDDMTLTSGNKEVFQIQLDDDDELTLKEGMTDMHFWRWNGEQNVDDGTTYVAPGKAYYTFYVGEDNKVWPVIEAIDVTFSVTKDIGSGRIYICGDMSDWKPDLQYGLDWHDGNVWSKTMRVPYNTTWQYKLVTADYDSPTTAWSWEWAGGSNRDITLGFNYSGKTLQLTWGDGSAPVII